MSKRTYVLTKSSTITGRTVSVRRNLPYDRAQTLADENNRRYPAYRWEVSIAR